MSYEDYQDLMGTGHESRVPTLPEDEFFHSVYIAGETRKNHINVEEQTGKFQVRGVQYNLDEVNMIITHTKEILVNVETKNRKDSIKCFSFKKDGPPWYGTSKIEDGSPRPCPNTSSERSVNDYCNTCKSQIIVAGIYCNPDGSPVLNDNNKPYFVFLRGKGMKYKGISDYLGDMFKLELSPIFEPVTVDSTRFEKSVVNNKRFVTNIKRGQESSNFGLKDVFILTKAIELPKEAVLKILEVSKNTLDKFNEKFDWSLRAPTTSSGYDGGQNKTPEGVMTMDAPSEIEKEKQEDIKQKEPPKQVFSFDDVNFD